MYFDTHAHYDSSEFEEDRELVLREVSNAGVDFIIDPGCDYNSSLKSLELSCNYEFIYSAVGLHPEEIKEADLSYYISELDRIKELVSQKKCVAIGEIGLDYYWDKTQKEKQKSIFKVQLEMARQYNKPVIIHDREAHADSIETVENFKGISGVFHCFSGSVETAKIILDLGFYIGFDGPITYKNAKKQIEVLKYCPLDRMLIETDSPYLSPVPRRGERNDSSNLRYIVDRISEVKELSHEKIAEITKQNAMELFKICP